MFENPPPENMTCSHAPSGSKTVELGLTCVAPAAVMNGHVACEILEDAFQIISVLWRLTGKSGLNMVPPLATG